MNHPESRLQKNCVFWFRAQYPHIAKLLFSCPNGGYRKPIEASILKAEGQVSGVADLILLIPQGKHASLCLEMKSEDGRQTPNQKSWQTIAELHGNKYVIIRSFDEFREAITNYLNGNA